jgi:hypothetical protein
VVLKDDEYELMPHQELEYLRKEVERLKRNPLGDTQASISLLDAINRLNLQIGKLNDVLAGANDEMTRAWSDTSVQEQMKRMLEQQEKLAKGIVAVATLVKDMERSRSLGTLDDLLPKPAPIATQSGVPMMQSDQTLPQPLPPQMQQRNPFMDAPNAEFQPMGAAMPQNQQQTVQFQQGAPQPFQQNAQFQQFQQNAQPMPPPAMPQNPQAAPGFMLRPGVQESRIPDLDVPLPPPRRY